MDISAFNIYIKLSNNLHSLNRLPQPGRYSDDEDKDYQCERRHAGHLQRKRTTRQLSSGAVPKKKARTQPLRKFFGQNEEIYVMDAKITGNIGRYFNVRLPNTFFLSLLPNPLI